MNNPDQTVQDKAAASAFRAEFTVNPFPLLAQTRAIGAIVPIQLPFSLEGTDRRAWMVTRMEEAVRILKDHEHFTVNPHSIGVKGIGEQNAAESADASAAGNFVAAGSSMITVDEPDHRRLRRLVSKAFTPRYIEGLRPRVQQIADTLLDRVQDLGQMDLVEDYALPLPINVISEMLGVPQANWPQIRVWSEALANNQGGTYMQEFGAYAAQLVAEKRQHPTEDLISQLIAIEEEGDRLSEAELLSMITLLIVGGHETTSNLIGLGTLTLLDHPDQLAKLKADLSLVPAAVEELLRFNGPVTMAAPRYATDTIEVAGQQIKKGDLLIVMLISANRDESQFLQPDELDITRTQQGRHLAFGYGIHTCLGVPLARLEGDIALTTLLKRMPNLRLSVPRESVIWRVSSNLRGVVTLPVAF